MHKCTYANIFDRCFVKRYASSIFNNKRFWYESSIHNRRYKICNPIYLWLLTIFANDKNFRPAQNLFWQSHFHNYVIHLMNERLENGTWYIMVHGVTSIVQRVILLRSHKFSLYSFFIILMTSCIFIEPMLFKGRI